MNTNSTNTNSANPDHGGASTKPRFQRAQRRQITWRPLSLDQMLPAEHTARQVWAYVESLDLSELYQQIRAVEGHVGRVFYSEPVHIVRGEGVWLYDADGRRYLDVYNNVPHVGHCHPHVVDALTRQIATLNTHSRYLHEGVLDYAQKLVAKFPDPLRIAMFACNFIRKIHP